MIHYPIAKFVTSLHQTVCTTMAPLTIFTSLLRDRQCVCVLVFIWSQGALVRVYTLPVPVCQCIMAMATMISNFQGNSASKYSTECRVLWYHCHIDIILYALPVPVCQCIMAMATMIPNFQGNSASKYSTECRVLWYHCHIDIIYTLRVAMCGAGHNHSH